MRMECKSLLGGILFELNLLSGFFFLKFFSFWILKIYYFKLIPFLFSPFSSHFYKHKVPGNSLVNGFLDWLSSQAAGIIMQSVEEEEWEDKSQKYI